MAKYYGCEVAAIFYKNDKVLIKSYFLPPELKTKLFVLNLLRSVTFFFVNLNNDCYISSEKNHMRENSYFVYRRPDICHPFLNIKVLTFIWRRRNWVQIRLRSQHSFDVWRSNFIRHLWRSDNDKLHDFYQRWKLKDKKKILFDTKLQEPLLIIPTDFKHYMFSYGRLTMSLSSLW